METEHSGAPGRPALPAPEWARSAPPVSMWTRAGVALRRWRMIVVLALVFPVVTAASLLLARRLFTAHTSFVPQESPAASAGLSQIASQFGFPLAARSGAASPQFYSDLLMSREILRSVIEARYEVSGTHPFAGDLVAFLEIKAPTRQLQLRDAMERLRETSRVVLDRGTGVVRLDVTTKSAQMSVAIAQRFLSALNEFNRIQRQSRGRAEREFVEQRMASAQRDLTNAEETLSGFYRRNRRFEDSPELVAEESRLQRQVALRQQLFLTLAQSYESAKIEEVRDTPVLTVLEQPERFVEPKRRGTVRKTFLALILGAGLGIAVALASEVAGNARQDASSEFSRFVRIVGETTDEVRAALRGTRS